MREETKQMTQQYSHIDIQYQSLLNNIVENGVQKSDRTGVGTLSIFGHQIKHNMQDGFPLLTTKKMSWKNIVTELLWFLKGDTNIKYLIDNGCHIWDGDAYKNYTKYVTTLVESYKNGDILGTQSHIEKLFSNPDNLTTLTQEEFINKIKTDDEFAEEWGDLGSIYGKQWRSWEYQYGDKYANGHHFPTQKRQIDQIQNLINELKTNPDSRRLLVNAWNIGELDQMVLPPCHYSFQVYTRKLSEYQRGLIYDKIYLANTDEVKTNEHFNEANIPTRSISLMWNQRSVDTFLGLPYNIASYALLLEILAKEVNMIPEELIGNLGDTHLYLNHIEQAEQQIARVPFKLPKLHINTEFWKTTSGECGVGDFDTNLKGFEVDDFILQEYQSHPAIKAKLNN